MAVLDRNWGELELLKYALELDHPHPLPSFCSITKNSGFILGPVKPLKLKTQQLGPLKKMEFW